MSIIETGMSLSVGDIPVAVPWVWKNERKAVVNYNTRLFRALY